MFLIPVRKKEGKRYHKKSICNLSHINLLYSWMFKEQSHQSKKPLVRPSFLGTEPIQDQPGLEPISAFFYWPGPISLGHHQYNHCPCCCSISLLGYGKTSLSPSWSASQIKGKMGEKPRQPRMAPKCKYYSGLLK